MTALVRALAGTKTVTIGDGSDATRVELVRRRGVLRLSGPSGGDPALRRLELPLDVLERAFGSAFLGADGRKPFLLFGGSSARPQPGLAGLLGAFWSEEEARVAFHALRESLVGHTGWAELVMLHGSGPRRLCWFQRHSGDVAAPAENPLDGPDAGRSRRRQRRDVARGAGRR